MARRNAMRKWIEKKIEIAEAAVVDVFGTKELPAHVRIVTKARRLA